MKRGGCLVEPHAARAHEQRRQRPALMDDPQLEVALAQLRLGRTIGEARLTYGGRELSRGEAVTWRLHGGYMAVTWRLHGSLT